MAEKLSPDAWRTLRDRSADPRREPGPINLNRYELHPAWSGIPTFLRLPICLTPDDLRAGNVEVAVLGAPVDMSGGQRGASFGPMAIRTAERYLPVPATTFLHQHVRISPFQELTVVDYGDAAVDPFSIEY